MYPVQIQNELAMGGTYDATIEEIKTFVQRRCQFAQIIQGTSGTQPLNQMYNYRERQQGNQLTPANNNTGKPTTSKEVKRKFEGNFRYCNIVGRKRIECRKGVSCRIT